MFTTSAVALFRRKSPRKAQRPDCTPQPPKGISDRGDRLLAPNEEPPLGTHLITPRFAYAHHGVYVGGGRVVHYAAFAKHWRRGPVEETSLTRFACGHIVWVRPARPHGLQYTEIVRRARSRIGENRYRFFSNNCEHLSEWCVNGEHRSLQVEQLLAPLRRISGALGDLKRRLERSTDAAVAARRQQPHCASSHAQTLPALVAEDSFA
jgi:lecithin:retinol acyltransferase